MHRIRHYYTLASLLDAQPAGLIKDPRHRLLWDIFMSSEKLQRLRISRRCYTLLNRARVKPENLNSFYRTYKLPKSAFFPLFLAVKSTWISERAQWKDERMKKIEEKMNAFPEERKMELEMLYRLERSLNSTGGKPVGDHLLRPKTIKRSNEISAFTGIEWMDYYSHFLSGLCNYYGKFTPEMALKAEAVLILGFDLQDAGEEIGKGIGIQRLNERFRILSKTHHPDKGGNPIMFRRLKAARDLLIKVQN